MRTDLAALSAIGLVALHCAAAAPTAAAEPAVVERPWQGTLAVGTTAVGANNVLPVPIAIGAGLLVERGMFGVEGAIHVDAATICDYPDGACGVLWLWDIAPRVTVTPDRRLSPYAAIRFQLTSSRSHGLVPAAGPRLGIRFRGQQLGFYLEAGPSFVSEADGMFGGFVSDRRWFPQVSTGMAFKLW
jgi:hypothetical protein